MQNDPLAQDTTPAQRERYFQLLRALTPAQRMTIVSATTRRMRAMAEAGIRLRHPTASDAEVRAELIELLYGAEARARLCGASRSRADHTGFGAPSSGPCVKRGVTFAITRASARPASTSTT